jgi:hypothetical protein
VIRDDAEIGGEQINEAAPEQCRTDEQNDSGDELRDTEQLLETSVAPRRCVRQCTRRTRIRRLHRRNDASSNGRDNAKTYGKREYARI